MKLASSVAHYYSLFCILLHNLNQTPILGGSEIVLLFLIPLIIIPFVFYLITLQDILKKISPENQKMPPANVWLLFISLFNLGWRFVVDTKVSDSLKAEFAKRGIST